MREVKLQTTQIEFIVDLLRKEMLLEIYSNREKNIIHDLINQIQK